MTIHAFTELHNDYPAFVNLSEPESGVFRLTVRSQGNAGRDVGGISLTRDQLLNLVNDARAYLGVSPQQPAGANVKQMVDRFLGWKLPDTFYPDCFISFDRERAKSNGSWPIGTNLLNADEARALFEHVLRDPAA
jgi:hypothetical protein